MKSPLRWERFRELLGALRRRRMRLIPDRRSHSEFQGIWGFGPPVDICEDNDSLTLTMEIPGLNEKDLKVKVFGDVLVVSGERNFERDEKGKNYRVMERSYGAFSRSFRLPSYVDPEHIDASYANGVLMIQIPKRAEAKPKTIGVKVAGELPKGKAASTAA